VPAEQHGGKKEQEAVQAAAASHLRRVAAERWHGKPTESAARTAYSTPCAAAAGRMNQELTRRWVKKNYLWQFRQEPNERKGKNSNPDGDLARRLSHLAQISAGDGEKEVGRSGEERGGGHVKTVR
jgi:hypothetical protein